MLRKTQNHACPKLDASLWKDSHEWLQTAAVAVNSWGPPKQFQTPAQLSGARHQRSSAHIRKQSSPGLRGWGPVPVAREVGAKRAPRDLKTGFRPSADYLGQSSHFDSFCSLSPPKPGLKRYKGKEARDVAFTNRLLLCPPSCTPPLSAPCPDFEVASAGTGVFPQMGLLGHWAPV